MNICTQFSMVSKEHFLDLKDMVADININKVPGALVECGVWKGGCTMYMMICQKEYNESRKIYLYDTFEGMTEPNSEKDIVNNKLMTLEDPKAAYSSSDDRGEKWCYSPIDDVIKNISLVKYNNENIFFIKGDICKTLDISENIPESIAILRLDTDWYESTKKELDILFIRLSVGGWIIIDDYFYWNGSHQATNEFLSKNKNNIEIIKLKGQLSGYASGLYIKKIK